MKNKLLYCLIICITFIFASTFLAHASQFKEVNLEYNGINYGKIIYSELINEEKTSFDIEYFNSGLNTVNWTCRNVLENSTCTIEPSDFDGYILASLCGYVKNEEIYTLTDNFDFVQLLANNQAIVGYGYGYTESSIKYGYPTSFNFGYNSVINPVHGDIHSYTLLPNNTLYILQGEIYNNENQLICTFYEPCFVKSNEFLSSSKTNQEITVLIDGKQISFDQPPTIINGRTLVPARGIFEALGAHVEWFPDTQTVVSNKGNLSVILNIDSNIMSVGNRKVELDVPAQIINNRTMVPARAIAEAFNCNVDWNASTKAVIIDTN